MKNIELVGHIDRDLRLAITHMLERNPAEWTRITVRQDTIGSPHKDTQSIILRGPLSLTDKGVVFDGTLSINYECSRALRAVVQCVVEQIMDITQARVLGRVMLVKLMPNGVIPPHVDEGKYAEVHDRYHVPLVSNLCEFTCGDQTEQMHVDGIYRINQRLEHSVVNGSATPRIHLIVDVVQ